VSSLRRLLATMWSVEISRQCQAGDRRAWSAAASNTAAKGAVGSSAVALTYVRSWWSSSDLVSATASVKHARGCGVRRALVNAASAGSSNDLGAGGRSHGASN
jgi:hypothetical protein